MLPSISICVPAYKRTDYLSRLLDSVALQTYKNFEVIITDDSPDNSIEELCKTYTVQFELHYFKNTKNLNTPENWNESVRKSKYEWTKIIHDDDWFADKDSLLNYAEAISSQPNVDFFFSAYSNVYEGTGIKQQIFLSTFWKYVISGNMETLISRNVVGPPSVTIYRKNSITYDHSMKYVVDIDFYCQYCKGKSWAYIDKPLMNVGINEAQVTKYTYGVAEVQLKESLLMLEKKDLLIFRNINVYDGWWRLIRNFEITQPEDIINIGYSKLIPSVLTNMISIQSFIPFQLLKIGLVSKIVMSFSYLKFLFFEKKN